MGIDKLSFLRTLSWDFSQPQLPEGATLTQALELLHRAADKTVVLVIDEAQHALTTEAGVNAMFGLKAARDQLNQGREGIPADCGWCSPAPIATSSPTWY